MSLSLALAAVLVPQSLGVGGSLGDELAYTNNLVRAERGLSLLGRSVELDRAAQFMADELARRGTLDHTDLGGRKPWDRAESFGYRNWEFVAENLALRSRDAAETVSLWLGSPGHRKNLENPRVRELGVGVATGPQGRVWVTVYGAREKVFPAVLEYGAPRVAADGPLTLSVNVPPGIREMRIGDGTGETGNWVPAVKQLKVDPAERNGRRTVRVEFRVGRGSLMAVAEAPVR